MTEFLASIRFEEPERLQLLAVIPVLFILVFIGWATVLYIRVKRIKRTFGSRYPFFGKLLFWFFMVLAMIPAIVSYAGPYIEERKAFIQRGSVEVIFLIDYSSSMFLKDTGLARLDIAVREVSKLVPLNIVKEGDRAGLFLMGLTGLARSYLTDDLRFFSTELSKVGRPVTLKDSNNNYWGSNLGSALSRIYIATDRQDMIARFGQEVPVWKPLIKDNRLIILFSDGDFLGQDGAPSGESFRKELSTSLAELRKRNIKIYTVGIGTLGGAPLISILDDYIPEKEYSLKLREDLKDEISRLNIAGLEEIGMATGSDLAPLIIQNGSTDASGYINSAIDKHRSTLIQPAASLDRQELWMQFLFAALGIIFLGAYLAKF